MSSQEYIRLAQSLPPQLLNFFTRFPPRISASTTSLAPSSLSLSSPAEGAAVAPPESPLPATMEATTTTLPPLSNHSDSSSSPASPEQPPQILSSSPSEPPTTSIQANPANPFIPHINPLTQKMSPPRYSLRRQADLYKLAHRHGVASLLPFSLKDPEERLRKRSEGGLRVKGTGVGQKVKGKKWERMLKGKLQKRREAMLAMPDLVKAWKKAGHGRSWTNWPK